MKAQGGGLEGKIKAHGGGLEGKMKAHGGGLEKAPFPFLPFPPSGESRGVGKSGPP